MYRDISLVKKNNQIDIVGAFGLQVSFLFGLVNFFTKINTIYSITGLGYVFINKQIKARTIRFFLSKLALFIFKNSYSNFIFQNKSDQKIFKDFGLSLNGYSPIIPGSGVDTDKFYPKAKRPGSDISFLFPARMLIDKGIIETLEAFKLFLRHNPNSKLFLAGEMDKRNPACISQNVLKHYLQDKRYIFLGHVENMSELYRKIDIVILPSYREGLSKVLIEAASSGLPIITTDVPGCREVVDHMGNGYLVLKQDIDSLFRAMKDISNDASQIKSFGKLSRKKAVEIFASKKINSQTIDMYNHVLEKSNDN